MASNNKLLCPFCGGTIRINTKQCGTKQAGCQSIACQAKGPLQETNELARHAFGVFVGDVNWP